MCCACVIEKCFIRRLQADGVDRQHELSEVLPGIHVLHLHVQWTKQNLTSDIWFEYHVTVDIWLNGGTSCPIRKETYRVAESGFITQFMTARVMVYIDYICH